MKTIVLTTDTQDTEKIWRSLAAIGHTIVRERYDNIGPDGHSALARCLADNPPDLIVYIGAADNGLMQIPSISILSRIGEIAPMIHICSDAGDKVWWSLLQAYDRAGCFAAQVAIDGNRATPISGFSNGIVLLSPGDPSVFHPRGWGDRDIPLAMAGGHGWGRRGDLVGGLLHRGILAWMDGDKAAPYAEMADFYCRSRMVFNCALNGSNNGMHVKGRVLEAGWAGACLLETAESPSSEWFTPGVDYLEYKTVDDVISLIENTSSERARSVASSLTARLCALHGPAMFWSKVFDTARVTHA